MKKKKKASLLNIAKAVRRELEIEQHGKQISFRPSRIFKSKRSYVRKKFKIDADNENI